METPAESRRYTAVPMPDPPDQPGQPDQPDQPDQDVRTHGSIDRSLCGAPVELGPGRAVVTMTAGAVMAADERGLVHGGFVFGLADHAAMLAVNEPTVVLAKAESRFLAPVRRGERLVARARVVSEEADRGRSVVEAEVVASEEDGSGSWPVFTGTFHCVVPERHVLDRSRGEREEEER